MSEIQNLQHLLPHTKFEMITDTASLVAIASPWWLPLLKQTSEIAALVLPIMGVIWLGVQIGFKVFNHFKGRTG